MGELLPQIQIVDSKTYVKQPWKNGGGSTEQLFVHPSADDYAWRMSVAQIDKPGPFSVFDGYMRVIVPLTGAMILKHDTGTGVKIAKFESYRFNGAWQTECFLLDGPTRDFNFIYRPNRIFVQVGTMNLKNALRLRLNGDRDFLYCAEGGLTVQAENSDSKVYKVATHELCDMKATTTNQSVTIKPESAADGASIIHLSIKNRE